MLTGDENIVDINFVVFWRIKDAQKYLFNIQKPDVTVKELLTTRLNSYRTGPLGSRETTSSNVMADSFGNLNPDGSICYGKS